MINFNDDVKAIVKKHNPNWRQIPNRIFLIRGTASGKTNSLFNLIN